MTTEISKITGLIGLAKRAGRIAVGYDAAVTAVKTRKAKCAVCASDLSPKTEKEWQYHTNDYSLLHLPLDKESLGNALGLSKPVGLLAVCDEGFAQAIQKICSIDKEEMQ